MARVHIDTFDRPWTLPTLCPVFQGLFSQTGLETLPSPVRQRCCLEFISPTFPESPINNLLPPSKFTTYQCKAFAQLYFGNVITQPKFTMYMEELVSSYEPGLLVESSSDIKGM